MEMLSVSQYAEQNGISERTVRNWCATGKMEGAVLVGKTWNIPAAAPLPRKGKSKVSPLLKRLREEKEGKVSGGIYHRTQIDLTYNSNHIEGSRLTHEQTRFIFETNTIGITDESVNVDDIVETTNHFRCIDLIIDRAAFKEYLQNYFTTENLVQEVRRLVSDGNYRARMLADYAEIREKLGGTGASDAVAEAMVAELRK